MDLSGDIFIDKRLKSSSKPQFNVIIGYFYNLTIAYGLTQWFPNGGEFDTFQGGNGYVCNFLLFSIFMHSLY